MDAPAAGWYFSTMGGAAGREPVTVGFARHKYGRPLLIDAGYVAAFDTFERSRPHRLDFHDILLVTAGRGAFRLDEEQHLVCRGVVLFTRPGEIRRWRVSRLDGACVFFREEFVAEAFSDPRFLDQFAFFRAGRPSGALVLPPPARRQYLRRFELMRREIASLRADVSHALRAVLYDMLVLLNRQYVARYGELAARAPNDAVERFRASVERNFRRRHRVADFAADLGLSPGHLNALCRRHARASAGRLIRRRIMLEAKRLLAYTDRTAAEIGYALGFDDPSYFARFFRREAGVPPRTFRLASKGDCPRLS
jgi:AraC-like DNA-binding protein